MVSRDRIAETIQVSSEVMSGIPVFKGTRVPIQTLIDHLEAGDSLEVFLADFPSVTREQAVAVLELAKDALLAEADATPAG
jgi:uncharacterized protein (DUF433 family)